MSVLFTSIILSYFIASEGRERETAGIDDVSQSDSVVFGPGISNITQPLPIEYIYIQLYSKGGVKYENADKNSLNVDFTSPHERAYVAHKVHYLGHGQFVVRYRVHRETEDLSISLKYNGVHVGSSPYYIGSVLNDKCYCPYRTVDKWMHDFNCPLRYDQIESDLSQYKDTGIDINDLYERVTTQFPNAHGIHYAIIDNKVYGHTFGTITDFRYMSDLILRSVTNKATLPDMEFIVQVSDWPQDRNSSHTDSFPFFSWCGSEFYRDIVWPQYDLLRHTIQAMDRVSLDMIMIQESYGIPWDERISKGFFRGRDSNAGRLDLVRDHRTNTDLFNVSLTHFFFHQYDEELYGPKTQRISLTDFFKYKYQINIDGTVAAYRFPFLMVGGSLILKQDSEYYEHFYHQLNPWEHYVPLKKDLSDVREKLEWALSHDEEARKIAENAYRFAVENLLPDKLYCYMYRLLKGYSDLQQGTPRVHPQMVEISTDDDKAKKSCKLCHHYMQDTSTTSTADKDEL
jgi:hypothetical protein